MHFWPNSFDRFWVILTPFKLFSIIFADAKNMHFLATFDQKAWAD
jgi:hypothetical protein